ncbi:MAG: 50S ribosomal protein L35 [Candidatus Wildermuthbacteria bacterium]|nr:50S ribosomal protein L35 [Candidatus Wildermuthbacteria bacterium]
MAKKGTKKIKAKTRKAILKRFRFTRSGKILRRPTGQDHFLAKKSGKARRNLRKWIALSSSEIQQIKKAISS